MWIPFSCCFALLGTQGQHCGRRPGTFFAICHLAKPPSPGDMRTYCTVTRRAQQHRPPFGVVWFFVMLVTAAMWWFPGLDVFGFMCFLPSQGGKFQKLDQVGLVGSPRSLNIVFMFNEEALKNFSNTLIWMKTPLSQGWSVHEQQGGRDHGGAAAEV